MRRPIADDATPADHIVARVLAARGAKPTLVAIDGRSGSGKTQLAAAVAEKLKAGGALSCLISMDEIYPGWDGLEQSVHILPRDILKPLVSGSPAAYRRWDWDAEQPGDLVDVPDVDVVVIEGVGSTAHACRGDFSVTVWVHAPARQRLDRACARTGQGDYAPHAARWAAQEVVLFGPDTYPVAPCGYDLVHDTSAPLEETG